MAKKTTVQDYIEMKYCGHCNGQGLIISDVLGAIEPFSAKFATRDANVIRSGSRDLGNTLLTGKPRYPRGEGTYRIVLEEAKRLRNVLRKDQFNTAGA